ncbi:hypothetical protein C8A00DRAFT_39615 [Chaetomidium leptoderma]|uniref:Adenylate kinase n=1 Tax=Chaetomidium leptoderma TaxID=669021 RepID=A0AAN6VVE3_9PEZI|nr:hypothetical protein C8A00DRAFT_39615 [Chaetomidium leptoderma]
MNYNYDETLRFIFVIAGKGTLSKRLAEDNDFTHISVGDLLRENFDEEPAITWHVEKGELLPMQYLLPCLKTAFRDSPSGCPIIVDGFPRRADQVRAFEKAFGAPHLVLFFQCPRDLAKKRVISRNEGREGDNAEVFDKRYSEYLELNSAILDYYGSTRGNGKLVEVNTSGETEVSYSKLLAALQARNEWPQLTGSPRSPRSPPSP